MNNDLCGGDAPLWGRLLHTAGRIEARLDQVLESEAGLSLAKQGVLRALACCQDPTPLSDLAKKLACVRSNVTQLMDRLESEGLVERRRDDPDDRRSVRAVLTEEGRRRYEQGVRALEEVSRQMFGSYRQEELVLLNLLLDKLELE